MTRTSGVVREWHRDEGWGVLDSPATPGGCWAGFGDVLVAGFRALTPGQEVEFDVLNDANVVLSAAWSGERSSPQRGMCGHLNSRATQ